MPSIGVMPMPPATRRYSGRPYWSSKWLSGSETSTSVPGSSARTNREPPRLSGTSLTAIRYAPSTGRSPTSEYERMSGSSSTITAMSRCAPVGYGRAPAAGSISIMRTSLATSRASRTRPGPKRLVVSIDPDEAAARKLLEALWRSQRRVEAVARVAGVLARERLRSGALAPLDRLEDRAVLGLGDVEAAVGLRVAGVDVDEGARRRERQREDARVGGVEGAAARETEQDGVEALVELDVALERGRGRTVRADDRVELGDAAVQRLELVRVVQALGGEPRGGALQDAAQVDRVGGLLARERAHDEAAARRGPHEPLVLQAREREAQRRARDPELRRERDLRQPLAAAQLAVEHELAQAQRRAQPLRQLRRGRAHRIPRRSASASVASTRVVVPYSAAASPADRR